MIGNSRPNRAVGAAFAPDLKAMRQKIGIARKQLDLHEDAYRAILQRVANHKSSRDCNAHELDAVLREMRRLGFKDRPSRTSGLSASAQVRMIHAVWKDLSRHVEDGSESALRAFVRRQTKTPGRPEGVAAPEFLRGRDAVAVLEGLKAWLARCEQRAALVEADAGRGQGEGE